MAFAGIAVTTASGWLMLLIAVLCLPLDPGVVRREERYLADRSGRNTWRTRVDSARRV